MAAAGLLVAAPAAAVAAAVVAAAVGGVGPLWGGRGCHPRLMTAGVGLQRRTVGVVAGTLRLTAAAVGAAGVGAAGAS